MAQPVTVARLDELPVGTMKGVQVGADEICIANVGGSIYAIEAACGHANFPLWSGRLTDNVVTCPFHGARYDVATGNVVREHVAPQFDDYLRSLGLPIIAVKPVRSYEVRVEGDDIRVVL